MSNNVTKLASACSESRKAKIEPIAVKSNRLQSKRAKKEAMRQQLATISVALVALTLTGLSLKHLTVGIQLVTGGATFESAAMAIGIDLGFIALEISQVIKLSDATAKVVNRFANPAIIGTMLASAGLNAFGFSHNAHGLMVYPAILMGFAIPALIYSLTRVAVALTK
jgi:hypothetical protein